MADLKTPWENPGCPTPGTGGTNVAKAGGLDIVDGKLGDVCPELGPRVDLFSLPDAPSAGVTIPTPSLEDRNPGTIDTK